MRVANRAIHDECEMSLGIQDEPQSCVRHGLSGLDSDRLFTRAAPLSDCSQANLKKKSF
jgi:hypothetical protein